MNNPKRDIKTEAGQILDRIMLQAMAMEQATGQKPVIFLTPLHVWILTAAWSEGLMKTDRGINRIAGYEVVMTNHGERIFVGYEI